MNLRSRFFAALLAAMLLLFAIPALAEVTPADYDVSSPQALQPGHLYAESALLVDEDTGEVLFSKNSRVRMYPASTTKIMTLLLGLESGIPLDSQVTIPAEAGDVPEGSSVVPVQPGDVMSFEDLLTGFMLSSGNDGANAVAVLTDGSIPAFVEHMNRRAAELGCEGTHYVNAHGYHDPEHYTTAQDLAIIARAAMRNADFRRIVAQPKWTMSIQRSDRIATQQIVSRNSLLLDDQKYYYADCTGIKTGHHSKAGWCFVGSAERDGMRVICVVLNCANENDKWYDAARLFEYGFTRYEDISAGALLNYLRDENFRYVQLEGADPADPKGGELELWFSVGEGWEDTYKVVDASEASRDACRKAAAERLWNSGDVKLEWERPLTAPVQEDDLIGTLTYLPTGGKAELTASRDVAAKPVETSAPTAAPTVEPNAPSSRPAGNNRAVLLVIGTLCAVLVAAVAVAIALQRARARRRRRRKRRGNRR